MIIDEICDCFIHDYGFNKQYMTDEAHFWGYEMQDTTSDFAVACQKLYGVLTDETLNLWEFKMACLDYMEQAGYRGSIAWNKFNNLSLREIGKKMDGIAVVER